MDIKNILFKLSSSDGIGNITDAAECAYEILSKYAHCRKADGNTVIGEIKGEGDYTLMLDAHIDEVGFIVTDVDENGFVTVKSCGGIDLRTLPARAVTIHGKERVKGVFCSTPPHLSSGEIEYKDISALKIDSFLSSEARDVISVGDYVTYAATPASLLGNRVTGKAFDNRAGVACLLKVAERMSHEKLPFNVALVLSDAEELGLRGAKTATFGINPDEAIAVDVTFGDGPDISPDEGKKLGGGAMIGISPILNKDISNNLIKLAKENDIPYGTEVMGRSTGTNSDVISVTRCGVKTGLVSIPLRNMHTDVEVVDIKDIEAAVDLLCEYILKGGAQKC